MKSDLEKLSWKKWGMSIHLQRSYGTFENVFFPHLHISTAIELCLWKWNCLGANSLSFDMWWFCETALNYNPSCSATQVCLRDRLLNHGGSCARHKMWAHTHKHTSACVRACVPEQDGVLIGWGVVFAYSWEENHLWFDECWQKGLLDRSWHS